MSGFLMEYVFDMYQNKEVLSLTNTGVKFRLSETALISCLNVEKSLSKFPLSKAGFLLELTK